MSIDRHYLRGYTKAMLFFEKLAYEDKLSPEQQAASIARGNNMQISGQTYLDKLHSSAYNLNKDTSALEYHEVDPSLYGDAYKNIDTFHRKNVEDLTADAQNSSWFTSFLYKDRRAKNAEKDYHAWLNGRNQQAVDAMMNNGKSWEQTLLDQDSGGAFTPSVAVPAYDAGKQKREDLEAAVSAAQGDITHQLIENPAGTFADTSLSNEYRDQLRKDTRTLMPGEPGFGAIAGSGWEDAVTRRRRQFFIAKYKQEHGGQVPNSQQLFDYIRTNSYRFPRVR